MKGGCSACSENRQNCSVSIDEQRNFWGMIEEANRDNGNRSVYDLWVRRRLTVVDILLLKMVNLDRPVVNHSSLPQKEWLAP